MAGVNGHLAIVIASSVVAILLLTLVHPVHTCPACGGRKVVQRGRGFRPCKRCKGTGKAYRRGAVFLHGLLREHAWPWVRDRISDSVAKRTDGLP